jgi:hypothetical protein
MADTTAAGCVSYRYETGNPNQAGRATQMPPLCSFRQPAGSCTDSRSAHAWSNSIADCKFALPPAILNQCRAAQLRQATQGGARLYRVTQGNGVQTEASPRCNLRSRGWCTALMLPARHHAVGKSRQPISRPADPAGSSPPALAGSSHACKSSSSSRLCDQAVPAPCGCLRHSLTDELQMNVAVREELRAW